MIGSSVRARLTLWHVAATSLVLLLFSFGVYSLFTETLYDRLDGNLRSAAQVAELSLNHEIEEHGGKQAGEQNVREVLRTMQLTSFHRTAIAIWDKDRLVAEKSGTSGLSARELSQVERGPSTATVRTFQTESGTAYRLVVVPVKVPAIQAAYQLTANESLEDVQAQVANLRSVLLVSVPFCILAAASGGYFLARKSLRPVADMARTVERISSANLEQRLTIHSRSDELGRLGETFNGLLDRIEQAFTQQQRFMADASHELRTPLSVALTASQVTLQKKDRGREELREALIIVQEQLRCLKRVVEDMFILAQVDSGAYRLQAMPLYLNEVADEALRAARVLAKTKAIAVESTQPDDELPYEGDEGLIRQFLLLLLDNAVKYTPDGGRIRFAVTTDPAGYRVEVSDTGSGIPAVDLPFIFDRFYRGDKARSRRDPGAGSGAGLGLSIAKWIVELHGGTINVASGSSGSTFRATLPYTHQHAPARQTMV